MRYLIKSRFDGTLLRRACGDRQLFLYDKQGSRTTSDGKILQLSILLGQLLSPPGKLYHTIWV